MSFISVALRRTLSNIYIRIAIAFLAVYGLSFLILHLTGAPSRIAAVNGLSVLFMAMPVCGLALLAPRYARIGYWLYFIWAIIWVADFFAVGFTMWRYGLPIESPVVVEALSNTNAEETREYFKEGAGLIIPLIISVPLLGYLLMRLVRSLGHRFETFRMRRWIAILLGAVLIILPLAYHRNHVVARADPVTRWAKFIGDLREQEVARVQLIAARGLAEKNVAQWKPAYSGPKTKTVVFVIGESSNRSDWSLFGYSRKTTPALDAIRDQMVLFPDTVSSFGSTDIEITRILTGATHAIGGKWQTEPDVLLLAKAAGYKTFWLSNQNDFFLNTVFGKEADYFNLVNHGLGERSDTSLDETLFPEIDKALADPAPLKFIIVHSIGSHQHYALRYPEKFAVFDRTDDDISKAMAAKWGPLVAARNTYDNTILYTDFFLSSVIARLRIADSPNAEMLFVSDHGQDVGHFTSHWGHQFKLESGFTVPMFMWTKSNKQLLANKQTYENRSYQTDELDWTLLGLMDVTTSHDQPQFNLLGSGYRPWQRVIDKRPYVPGKSHVTMQESGG